MDASKPEPETGVNAANLFWSPPSRPRRRSPSAAPRTTSCCATASSSPCGLERVAVSRRLRWPSTSIVSELDKQFQRMRGRCTRPFSGRDGATETTNWETWTWPRDAEGRARDRSTAGATASGSEVWTSDRRVADAAESPSTARPRRKFETSCARCNEPLTLGRFRPRQT
jgi:hypothetical protein